MKYFFIIYFLIFIQIESFAEIDLNTLADILDANLSKIDPIVIFCKQERKYDSKESSFPGQIHFSVVGSSGKNIETSKDFFEYFLMDNMQGEIKYTECQIMKSINGSGFAINPLINNGYIGTFIPPQVYGPSNALNWIKRCGSKYYPDLLRNKYDALTTKIVSVQNAIIFVEVQFYDIPNKRYTIKFDLLKNGMPFERHDQVLLNDEWITKTLFRVDSFQKINNIYLPHHCSYHFHLEGDTNKAKLVTNLLFDKIIIPEKEIYENALNKLKLTNGAFYLNKDTRTFHHFGDEIEFKENANKPIEFSFVKEFFNIDRSAFIKMVEDEVK